jgi:hypothetical protein
MSEQTRPTPRTDAQCRKEGHPGIPAEFIRSDFARELENESDAREERIRELDLTQAAIEESHAYVVAENTKLREAILNRESELSREFGEHLYFLNAPSLPDGFRMAAERIKSSEDRSRELDKTADELLADRDKWEGLASKLATLVANAAGADFGEHSNINCPVQSAIEFLEAGGLPENANLREALRVSMIRAYTLGYQRGHEETVEGCAIHVIRGHEDGVFAEEIDNAIEDGSLPEARQALAGEEDGEKQSVKPRTPLEQRLAELLFGRQYAEENLGTLRALAAKAFEEHITPT